MLNGDKRLNRAQSGSEAKMETASKGGEAPAYPSALMAAEPDPGGAESVNQPRQLLKDQHERNCFMLLQSRSII